MQCYNPHCGATIVALKHDEAGRPDFSDMSHDVQLGIIIHLYRYIYHVCPQCAIDLFRSHDHGPMCSGMFVNLTCRVAGPAPDGTAVTAVCQ